ncbi:MAG: alpha/beta fold hydrolase, partial [Acidimicrobiia bacterium]
MIGILAVSLMLWGGDAELPPPADGLSLLPDPRSPAASRPARPVPPPVPAGPAALGVLAAGAWAARGLRNGRKDPLVVFITGYGSESEASPFAPMIEMLGLAPGQVRTFDYRWVEPADAHSWAARQAGVDDLADGLQGYLSGLAETERPIYLVGHSLGGTTLAELLARWDRYPSLRVPEVAGAALLDPPIARGPLGAAQSSPRLLG